jgi:hypothetical protein
MEIWHRQEFSFSGLDPIISIFPLTFRTVSVSARIVTNADDAAGITSINMSA